MFRLRASRRGYMKVYVSKVYMNLVIVTKSKHYVGLYDIDYGNFGLVMNKAELDYRYVCIGEL